MTTTPTYSQGRLDLIAEGLYDLEAVFFDPGCYGTCTVGEMATSLASEFIGAHRDDEIVGRLWKMAGTDDPKAARRHLTFVRRKLLARWGIVPIPSDPLVPDRRLDPSPAAEPLVAARQTWPESPQAPRTDIGATQAQTPLSAGVA